MPVTRFQQLDVYVSAIEYVGLTRPLVLRLRRGDPALADQLHRSVISTPLNIAEGAGEYSAPDKARFYRYALRSCTETLAILDVCKTLGVLKPEEQSAYEVGDRIVAMLTRLIAATNDRAAKNDRAENASTRRPPPPPK